MFPDIFLLVSAFIALTVNAAPVLEAHNTDSLIRMLERATPSPLLNFNYSSESSVIYPDSELWAAETHRWSNWSAPVFDVVFIPGTEQDLSAGLKYLTDHNLSFLATGTNHGYSTSLASLQHGVDISLEYFNNVTVNTDDTITVGGGVHFRDVWKAAYDAGRELALASSCVGAGGVTLGGGHGFIQGKYGLVIDEIISMRVALWNGTIINVSATENPDLFWAMRGAGHNFGIMLEFTLETWPQTNGGMYYNADMSFTDESLEGVLGVINDIIPTQEADLGLDFVMFTNSTTNKPELYLGLVYLGERAKGEDYAARFATSNTTGIERTFLNDTIVRWDQLSDTAVGGFISVACEKSSSGVVDQTIQNVDVYTAKAKDFDIPMTVSLYTSYKEFTQNNPSASQSTVLFEVFAQEAVRAQDASQTAYGNREYGNILTLIQGSFTDYSIGSTVDGWAKAWRGEVMKHSGYERQHVYLNYAHGDESLEAMYGYEPWRLERLRNLKAKYDPHNFFSHYNSFLV